MKDLRAAHVLAAKSIDPEMLVFLDEFGANLAMVPRYGRAPSGARVHINKPTKRGPNVTFVGAMTLQGIVTLDALAGSCTKERFLEWVVDIFAPTLRVGQIVVMDNLKAHHNPAVRELIEAAGATILFIPPYSPDMNAIEECWSKIKTFMRKASARTHDSLLLAAAWGADMVTPADAQGWTLHAGYAANQLA